MTFLLYIFLAIANAMDVTAYQVTGKWSDEGCENSFIDLQSNGKYKFYKWRYDHYEIDTEMYWWIEEGMIAIGTVPNHKTSIVGAIAIGDINSRGFIGAYALIDGTQKGIVMTKCY